MCRWPYPVIYVGGPIDQNCGALNYQSCNSSSSSAAPTTARVAFLFRRDCISFVTRCLASRHTSFP
ncbi:hypothetical protein LIA77_09489 [Sarocladium implicatum]|nr:hypothetical protein LIA77_09489 [Sarocladium implicatum]